MFNAAVFVKLNGRKLFGHFQHVKPHGVAGKTAFDLFIKGFVSHMAFDVAGFIGGGGIIIYHVF